jgi:hypothetical protein
MVDKKIKYIGVFGPSLAKWDHKQEFSYITKLKNYFDAEIVYTGVAQASEERLLFTIKKTKKLDLAIVIHTMPDFVFVPSIDRDFNTLDNASLISKIPDGDTKEFFSKLGHSDLPTSFIELWEKIPNTMCFSILKDLKLVPDLWPENNKEFDRSTLDAFIKDDIDFVRKKMREKSHMVDDIEFWIELFESFRLFRKYLYHHDLQMNRYYGALIQIDQYFTAKKIPVVHCCYRKEWFPSWFKFESGVVDWTICPMQHESSEWYIRDQNLSENSVNPDGNKIIFEKLLSLINQAIEKLNK